MDTALYGTAATVCHLVSEENTPVAVVGGVALNHHGVRRPTYDVDALVGRPVLSVDSTPLAIGGQKTRVGDVDVDLLWCDGEYGELYEEALEHARTVEREEGVFVVVTAPYLAALKLLSGRGRDEEDLRGLLQIMPEEEVEEARRIVARHLPSYYVENFDSEVAMAELERAKKLKKRLL